MGRVGRFSFNDGLENNPERKILNADYVQNLSKIDELFDKCIVSVKTIANYAPGAAVLQVEESAFFRIGDDIIIRTPTGTSYTTKINQEPTNRTQLPIIPLDAIIPINSQVINSIPEVAEARGNQSSLAERLIVIENNITTNVDNHKAEINAHPANKINTSGLSSLGNPQNVQAALDALSVQKMNATEINNINASMVTGDNTVRSEFQAADTVLHNTILNTFNPQHTDHRTKINLYTNVGNYIVRDSNGFPKFPNVSFTQGSSKAVKTQRFQKGSNQTATNNTVTLSALLHANINGVDYLYQIGGWDTTVPTARSHVRRNTIDANANLGSWTNQAGLTATGYSNNGAVLLNYSNGKKHIFTAIGGTTTTNLSNDLVAANGTISSWTAKTALPSSVTRPATAAVTIGGQIYVYVIGNNTNRRVFYQRWNQSTDNVIGAWKSTFGGPEGRGTSVVPYGQNLILIGGSRHIYLAKLDDNGNPNFFSLGELMPKFLNFPKIAILNHTDKDYLYVTGGTTGSDYNAGTANIDSFLFEIDPNTLDLTLVDYSQGNLFYNAIGSGFAHANISGTDWMFIHSGNGGTASGSLMQRLELSKNVTYRHFTVTVSGGECCINNEIVSDFPTQQFTNVISMDPINPVVRRFLFARKDGNTKEFKLLATNFASDPKTVLIGEVVINSLENTTQAIFYDQNPVQDLINAGLYRSNSIIKGCALTSTSPFTVNVASGMFDIGGKVFGTTGMTVNMNTFTERELDMLGPVNLPYKFEQPFASTHGSHGSMCNVSFPNGKRFIYRLGGYDGSSRSSVVQKADLNSNGILISDFSSAGCAPLLQASHSIAGAIPIIMDNGDRRIFMVCGGTNRMLLSSPINQNTGNIDSWTQYAATLPFTSSTAWVRSAVVNNTLHIYVCGGGSLSESVAIYTFNTASGSITFVGSSNFSATLDNSAFCLLDNKFAYLIGGNGNRKIYIGNISSTTGTISWRTVPIADTLNNMQLHNAEIIKINGVPYLYIFGGNSGTAFASNTKIPGMMRIKLDLDDGVLDGEWEFPAFAFDDPSEQACTTVVEANNNIIVYRSVGHTALGGFTGDSYKINMIPIHTSNFIGHSLLYFDRSNNGTLTIKATKRWDKEIDPLTIIGLVSTGGLRVFRTISVAKERKYDTGWRFADNNSRWVIQHNILYPIKNERLMVRSLTGASETQIITEANGYGAIVYHRPNRFVSVVLFGVSGVALVLTDTETPASSSLLEGQARLILEA